MIEVLAAATVGIILPYVNVSDRSYALKLHNVICQLYFNKKIGKKCSY